MAGPTDREAKGWRLNLQECEKTSLKDFKIAIWKKIHPLNFPSMYEFKHLHYLLENFTLFKFKKIIKSLGIFPDYIFQTSNFQRKLLHFLEKEYQLNTTHFKKFFPSPL
jgi:hypothetical protein